MAGAIFTVFGFLLSYITFWEISERLNDDRLGRDGSPWGIIFIIGLAAVLLLGGGISSMLGKKWWLKVVLGLAGGTSRGGLRSSRNNS
jgi:uncharacterized membrane protein